MSAVCDPTDSDWGIAIDTENVCDAGRLAIVTVDEQSCLCVASQSKSTLKDVISTELDPEMVLIVNINWKLKVSWG
jgi:hypothetical protein